MTQTLEVDLDAPTAVVAPPKWRTRMPWIMFGVALAAFVMSLVVRMPAPIAGEAEAPPTPAPTVSELDTEQTGGVSPGATVWRDDVGALVGVMFPVAPFNQEPVGCRLVVDGQEVTAEGRDGFPAVCVWVREAS